MPFKTQYQKLRSMPRRWCAESLDHSLRLAAIRRLYNKSFDQEMPVRMSHARLKAVADLQLATSPGQETGHRSSTTSMKSLFTFRRKSLLTLLRTRTIHCSGQGECLQATGCKSTLTLFASAALLDGNLALVKV